MQLKRNALPARHELKYFINPAELEALRQRLRGALAMDGHCVGGRPYAIRSLYFDDIEDSAFYDKQAGVMHRDKYRIRIYNLSDAVIKLECKTKVGSLISKRSLTIPRDLADQLIAGDPEGLERTSSGLLSDMYREMTCGLMRPVVIVEYERIPYVYKNGNVRITLDTNISSSSAVQCFLDPDIPRRPVLPLGQQLLEVKYDEYLPDFIYRNLQLHSLRQTAFSKYYICRKYTR